MWLYLPAPSLLADLLIHVFFRYLVEFVLPGDTVLPRDDISLDSGFSDDEEEVVSKGIHSINQKVYVSSLNERLFESN